MIFWKSNKTKIVLLLALVFLYLVSFFKNDNQKVKKSVIEKKYKDTINEIVIKEPDDEIVLLKKNNIWTAHKKGSVFPVSQNNVKLFLRNLTNIVIMYKEVDGSDVSILRSGKHCVEVSARIDGKMSKKVYFFDLNGENFFKNVFIQGEKYIYKIENKFESFLNASENFWGEPFLIPKNISEKNHQTQNVQCITFLYYESKKIIHNNSHKFPKIANRLFELNHGKYFFEKIHPNEDSNENPIFELTVEYDTGELFFLQFQKYDAENYTVSYKIIDTFSHTTYDYDYTVFISTWTFSNIVDLFFKD